MKQDRFFIVARLDGVGHSPKVRHENYELAQAEAKRLASSYPGVEFFVLESLVSFTLGGIVRQEWNQ